MKTLLIIIVGLLSFNSFATGLKIMNFNTMCDLCGKKKDHGTFNQRLDALADTINRHNPDLLSLQEFRTKRQVIKRLDRRLNSDYRYLFAKGLVLSYADPVLAVRKDRFDVLKTYGMWLGPNAPFFSFGWRFGIPRRVQIAFLKDKITNTEFIFVGTHFDNSYSNKRPSAIFLNKYLKQFNLPVLFAGDTNLKTPDVGYTSLLDGLFVDTFLGDQETTFYSNGPYQRSDACNLSKAPEFPLCRIDHVLVSENAPWTVKSWGVDVFKYHGKKGFVSDHRAVVVELE